MLQFAKRLLFAKSFFTLVQDPEQTQEIFKIVEYAPKDSPGKRHLVEHTLKDPGVRALLQERYLSPHIDLQELRNLPSGTLGHAFAEHMLRI